MSDADERKKRATIVNDGAVLLDISGQAPPPSKNFIQVILNTKGVIFREWKISLRNEKTRPSEEVCTLEEFIQFETFHDKIQRIWDSKKLEEMKMLAKKNIH
eukprot:Sdes_comp23149_c0_seq1m21452